MNAKKQREKNRRRANKLAQEAWQAAEDDRVDLAIKIIQRAIDLNPANPVLWHDRGLLLVMNGNDDEAADSLRAAIQLVPEFAEAFAALAAGLGDAVLFCTRSRLVRVGGAFGLKPVKHGLNRIESGSRFAVGIPLHDFR